MVQKFTNSQLRYYQNDFALCYKNNGIGQTDTSLLEDDTIKKKKKKKKLYRIVKNENKKNVNITCYLSAVKL